MIFVLKLCTTIAAKLKKNDIFKCFFRNIQMAAQIVPNVLRLI